MMRMRFNLFLTTLFLLVACSHKENDSRPMIAVSIEPQRNILEQIAGDKFRIVTIMPGGDNPETFDPSPIRRIDIEKSKVYFTIGLLPFENNLIKAASDKSKFVDTSEGIKLIYGTHTHVHDQGESAFVHSHTSADPHIWTSVQNVRKMAGNMVRKLEEIDPDNAHYYRSNLERYCARLDSLDSVFSHRLDASSQKAFLVWHPSLSYFANDYGLEQIAVSSDTKEMSVTSLVDIISRAKADSIQVMFIQREFDSRQAEIISKSTDARLVSISPSAYDWEKELSLIVNELSK